MHPDSHLAGVGAAVLIAAALSQAGCDGMSRTREKDTLAGFDAGVVFHEAGSSVPPATDGAAGASDSLAPAPDSFAPPPTAHWVSPTGAAPWTACMGQAPLSDAAACSLATANASAAPGDVIVLRGGTYGAGIAPARSGTEAARITFHGQPGEKVLITGAAAGLVLAGRSHVTVDSVTVQSCDTFADLTTADHVWILNSTLTDSSDTGGWPMGIKMYNNAHHNRIVNCTVGNSGYQTADDDIGGVMNVGDWTNPTDTTGYNLFDGNTFYHGGHHVVEIASHHNIFRNNTFHNENWTSCPRASTGNLCGDRGAGLGRDELNANWNVFEGNRFAFAGSSIDDIAGSNGLSVRNRNTIVRRNMFYLNDGAGLHFYVDWTTTYEASYSYAYHNVFYKNGGAALNAGTVRATYGLLFENSAGNSAPIPIVGAAVKNNLFFDDIGGSIFFYYTDPAKQAVAGNFFQSVNGSDASGYFTPSLGANNTLDGGDPLFVNIAGPATVAGIKSFDFHLQSGSPAVDHGTFLTSTASAGSGTSLPVADANYFIDGYGIVDGDLIQLQGQSQTARVTAVDYATGQLTLDRSLTWTANQGVSLPYTGAAPDPGAFER